MKDVFAVQSYPRVHPCLVSFATRALSMVSGCDVGLIVCSTHDCMWLWDVSSSGASRRGDRSPALQGILKLEHGLNGLCTGVRWCGEAPAECA